MTSLKLYVALALAGVLLVLGFSMYSCSTKPKPAPLAAQSAITTAQTKEAALGPKIKAQAIVIAADIKAVAHDVAGFKHSTPVPAPKPITAPGTALSLEEPLGAPPVVAHDPQDQALINDQAKLIADQAAQITNLTQDRDAYKAEALASRAQLAVQVQVRNWSVSAIYGTNQTAGAGVEYRYHAVQVGVDVVRRQIAGGQTTLEALGRVGFSF